jgi:dihydrofolate synthase/folylpolyglutamate synthase
VVVRGYRTALEELFRLRRFGLVPSLETIRTLLTELGSPEERFPSVHITGSKGKGSVAAMTAAILTGHGYRTGLYTSPHLLRYRERARVDGVEISPREVVEGLRRVERAVRALERRGALERTPTFFETTTALAFDWFARSKVTAAVVEVGIGGRWDATNVLRSRVGIVTTLELEHTEILGPTLEAIATEKAGIFHPGMKGALGHLPPVGRRIIERVADRHGIGLWHLEEEITVADRVATPRDQRFVVGWPKGNSLAVTLPLIGRFQSGNAAMAVAAASLFLSGDGASLRGPATRRALAKVRWRGRMERMSRRPPTYFDVAHTPESAIAVAESVAEVEPFADAETSAIVFGCLEGKDADGLFSALSGLARTVILVPVRSQRGRSTASLRPLATAHFPRVVLAPSATDGLALGRLTVGPSGVLLAVGSDYLIGELLRAVEPGAEEEPDLSDPGSTRPPSTRVEGRP